MCGISGVLNLDGRRAPSQAWLEGMLKTIFHRGPDEEGVLIDRELAMGMRRLSIIDLSDGKQPIFSETGRFGIVFNGEIYNYRELRQELLSRGHILKTHSDTEVIVHLYEESGPESLKHLRGMFGLAIWDNEKRELFVARDRLGIKPLYYTVADGDLVFGSEIKSLFHHPSVRASLDLQALSQYVSLKYVCSPKTLFEGIHSLPPGHFILASGGNIKVKRYWDLSFAKPQVTCSEDESLEQLLSRLREAISIHLRSDVPFGAFLSGGLDSSIIVALMTEALSSPVKAFSVGFDGAGISDEIPYASQVAKAMNCEHHVLKITSNDFLNYAEDVLWHMDQPIADQATVATYMVAKLAREHVKMVLTGEGGDELFAGYARYAGERYSPYFQSMPQWFGSLFRFGVHRLPGLRRAKIALGALSIPDEARRFSNWFPLFADDTKKELMELHSPEIQEGMRQVFDEHLSGCDAKDPVERMLYVDTKLWLPDYLLLRGDKLTMANSLEGRVPFLDHEIVEFAAQLPANLKLRGGQRKYLLKKLGLRLLPPAIVERKKQGFPIPIDQWLRNEARSKMEELLSPKSVRARGLFSPKFVEKLISQHVSGYANHGNQIWGLVSLEMWMQRFIDRHPVL